MAVITGTSVGETLTGTIEDDTITGLGGDDTLVGLAGSDLLRGGILSASFNLNGSVARLADFNADGRADILQTEANGGLRVSRSHGTSFEAPEWWGTGAPTNAAIADVNDDGRADIVDLNLDGNIN